MNSKNKNVYSILGLMSGTSLDGLDLAYCVFTRSNNSSEWTFKIEHAKTISHSKELKKKLREAINYSGENLTLFDVELGIYFGNVAKKFILKNKLKVDFIASHGHTIFHQPQKNMTLQIGHGAYIAKNSGVDTICDFRTSDVALNGQGAPLVPIGDSILFKKYKYCLNLGGIANISVKEKKSIKAFDVFPCNIVLNELANQKGLEYDKDGHIARAGSINHGLLAKLLKVKRKVNYPLSLGREWIEKNELKIINSDSSSIEVKMNTYVEALAIVLSENINSKDALFVTGGGAHNKYLIERITHYCKKTKVIVPEKQIVDFKEALIFAFLGLKRVLHQANSLKSVTKSSRDNCGGAIYLTC